ncbi:MAG: hypothetical protein DRP09_15480 [Candidatus Thorarchaeota archaeon]|nr:MAG: hypothetical protein DRP09_15480 [Candidatus Thorarchaeota archaeon]
MIDDSRLPAEKKMSKARALLVLSDIFFGTISMKMHMVQDDQGIIPTIATDGVEIRYNKEWIEKQTVMECKALLAHECAHVALKHHLRRQNREFGTWNAACDFAIDPILKDAGYELPDGGHIRGDMHGTSAEKNYAILQSESMPKKPSTQSGDDDGNTNDKKQDNQDGVGSGNKQQKQKQKGKQPIQADKNHPGLVLDAPINMNDKKEVQVFEENLDIAIEQAAQAAKKAGQLPGSLEGVVTKNKEHKVDYRNLLRDFLEKSLHAGDYDWLRPDQRFIEDDIYLPGLDEEEDSPKIIFAIDASGSVGDSEKQIYANEISGVIEEFDAEILAIYFDTKIQNTQILTSEELPVKLNWKGGGGTRFKPVFEYIRNEKIECEAILFFTDMGAWDWDDLKKMPQPDQPVIWMDTYSDMQDKDVPFGEIVKLSL